MDRQHAELLMRHLSSLDELVGAIADTLDRCEPSNEIEAARAEVFKAGYELHASVARRVVTIFPDLDPDSP